jgi:hypothetical protein
MCERESRYKELEALIESNCPGSIERLSLGHHLVFIREEPAVSDLSDEELHFLGALIKVSGKYGCTLVIGPQDRCTVHRIGIKKAES